MKKILSILLTALVLLTIAVSCAQDVTVDENVARSYTGDTFMVNGKYYGTFEEALKSIGSSKAIGDQDDVVYLLKNASGPGAVIDGMDVTIDFQGYTFDFTNVDALIDGTSDQTFGLKITGESNVNLKGMEKISLFDDTAKLTMIYIENSTVSLEDAPKLQVEDNQYVFWVAEGATLTIGTTVTTSKTNVSGGIKLSGTSSVTVEESEVEIKDVVVEGTEALVSIDESAIVTTTNVDIAKAINEYNTGSGTVSPDSELVGHTHTPDSNPIAKLIGGTWYDVTVCTGCGSEISKTEHVFSGEARIDAVGYASLESALSAARNGQTITLLKDITNVSTKYVVNKAVTLDGDEHSISGTGSSVISPSQVSTTIIEVGTETSQTIDSVEFKNLTVTNSTDAGSCIRTYCDLGSLTLDNVSLSVPKRPLTIEGNITNNDGIDVVIIDSDITASDYYAITFYNKVNATITDSIITGYSCVYMKPDNDYGAGSEYSNVKLVNTHLHSLNKNTGVSNEFAMIVTESSNISFELENCHMHCGYTDPSNIAYQALFCLSEWFTPKYMDIYVHGGNTTIDSNFPGEIADIHSPIVLTAWINCFEEVDTFSLKIEKSLYNSLSAQGVLDNISPYYWDDSASNYAYLKYHTADTYVIFGIEKLPSAGTDSYYGKPIDGTSEAIIAAYDTYDMVVAGYWDGTQRKGLPSIVPEGYQWAEYPSKTYYHGFAYYLESLE